MGFVPHSGRPDLSDRETEFQQAVERQYVMLNELTSIQTIIVTDDDMPGSRRRRLPYWLMTFADLVTLLLAFFVLVLSFSQIDMQRFRYLTESFQQTFGAVATTSAPLDKGMRSLAIELGQSNLAVHSIAKLRADILSEEQRLVTAHSHSFVEKQALSLKQALMIDLKGLAVSVFAKGQKIIISIAPEAILNSNGTQLSSKGQILIKDIAEILANFRGEIRIVGHSDILPSSSFRTNWSQSTYEATVVGEQLFSYPFDTVTEKAIIGVGENQPVTQGEQVRAKQRIDIELIQTPEQMHQNQLF